MLTIDDTPTIKRAIERRLDAEPGIVSVHTVFGKFPGSHITVQVNMNLGWIGEDMLALTATFDLPDPFEHGHLVNEIDEIAESAKTARKQVFGGVGIDRAAAHLPGTGRRGMWSRYGLRDG